jgi:hypothetical protein
MLHVENPERVERLMRSAVSRLDLDLSGISVLTEGASGNFVVTPLIAAIAGSPHVVALSADSRYGRASEIAEYIRGWAVRLGVADRIEMTTDRLRAREAGCSLITNLGFVRPIDAGLVECSPADAVVALMWEPWEFRPEDVDLKVCRDRGIPVLGTCETDIRVGTFRYVGLIVLKLLLESALEVDGSNILVVGASPFLQPTIDVLRRNGANVTAIAMDDGGLEHAVSRRPFEEYDAVALVDHRSRKTIVGPGGLFAPEQMIGTGVRLVHVCGVVDDDALAAAGIQKIPPRRVSAGYMTLTTDYVGPRPVIDLHAAGLKVGEIVVRSFRRGSTYPDAVAAALKSGLALDFDLPSHRG